MEQDTGIAVLYAEFLRGYGAVFGPVSPWIPVELQRFTLALRILQGTTPVNPGLPHQLCAQREREPL